MNTSLSWIKAYVPGLDVTAQQYTDAMTLSGTKVEGYEELSADLDKIVVGEVVKMEKHPEADRLVVCQVNVGKEIIQIVTGAPNVKEGVKYPVVLDGGRVAGDHDGNKTPGGVKIKKGKLRGVESAGMMCSIEELGLSRDYYPDAPESGLYPLGDDAVPGQSVTEYMGLDDVVFEYEITSNRVDCYSVLGIAREAAVTFDKKFVMPEIKKTGNEENVNDFVKVEVNAPELCSRYCARLVRNIKLAPSPKWMQQRLIASGIRPINNIVDITNYVMEEFGQPMHAYDYDTLAGHKIIVRRAEDNEEFQTLDGQIRKLDSSILMICDADKAVGIAGIMGGENSKITDDVRTMLFEAACFDGTNIRLSSKKVGLRTEASGIFEKGLDPHNAEVAINRACQLIEEMGAGEVVGGIVDVCSPMKEQVRIEFCPDKINALLGTDIGEQTMLDIFKKLELEYDSDKKEVVIPSFRQDLICYADLAEEVARIYGYDKMPVTLPRGETTGKLSFKLRIEETARRVAQSNGFSQAMTYSFESPKVFDKLLLNQDSPLRKTVVISNPLGEDYSIMRTITLNGMLTSLSTNYNRRNKDVRLYEIGNIYIPKQIPVTELPEERTQLTFGMYGEGDFFTMKGVVEEFLVCVGMNKKLHYNPNAGKPFLHPGRQAEISYDGKVVGYMGEIHPEVADNYAIGERTYVAVLDMPVIVDMATYDRKYEGIAKFPAVTRDISMLVKKDIMVGQIEDVIEKKGGKLVESCELFDVYEGAQIMMGYKSVAYSLTLRAADHTLEESEITAVMDKILGALGEMGIELRQ